MKFCQPVESSSRGGGGGGKKRASSFSQLLNRQGSRHSLAAAAAMDETAPTGSETAEVQGPYDDKSSTCSDAQTGSKARHAGSNQIFVEFPPREEVGGMKRDVTSTTIASTATAELTSDPQTWTDAASNVEADVTPKKKKGLWGGWFFGGGKPKDESNEDDTAASAATDDSSNGGTSGAGTKERDGAAKEGSKADISIDIDAARVGRKREREEDKREKKKHQPWFGRLLSSIFLPEPDPSCAPPPTTAAPLPRMSPKVLLEGATTAEEHFELVDGILERVKGLHGDEGLREAGFEYREVRCDMHSTSRRTGEAKDAVDDGHVAAGGNEDEMKPQCSSNEDGALNAGVDDNAKTSIGERSPREDDSADPVDDPTRCTECATRLHHSETSTLITQTNRPRFIADGDMYEEMARLCQEFAQDLMRLEGGLEWVTVCDDKKEGAPVKALVHRNHGLYRKQSMAPEPDSGDEAEDKDGSDWKADGKAEGGDKAGTAADAQKSAPAPASSQPSASASYPAPINRRAPPQRKSSTLLIATGKGKVRAGIFSRAHLMTSGIEPSTALPMVREAKRRGMRCVIPDPNARGDRRGMETFGRTVSAVMDGEGHADYGQDISGSSASGDAANDADSGKERTSAAQSNEEQHGPLYVLAHSASGAQFVRHLRESASASLVPRIKAVAFTDSTHNVQWTKKHTDPHHPELSSMLESPASLYVRSNSVRDDSGWTGQGRDRRPKDAGEEADRDHFWRHRFGDVRTVWAGTEDHSLTNWAAHLQIWDHFDRFFEGSGSEESENESEVDDSESGEGRSEDDTSDEQELGTS